MRHLSLVSFLTAVLCAGAASAQVPTRAATTEAGSPHATPRRGARLRFGWGGSVGMTGTVEEGRMGYGLLGLYVRVGTQFNDFVGLHLDLSGTTLVLSGAARAALIADLTFGNRFSVGTGFMVGASYTHLERCGNLGCADAGWDTGMMAGIPIHLGYKDANRITASSRWGFGLSFDGEVGRMLDGRTALGGHLNFGWEWY